MRRHSPNIDELTVTVRRSSYAAKVFAVGWMLVLFSAWLNAEITIGFAVGSVVSGIYWTAGSLLGSVASELARSSERAKAANKQRRL